MIAVINADTARTRIASLEAHRYLTPAEYDELTYLRTMYETKNHRATGT